MNQTLLQELQNSFYDLILKKSLQLPFKSIDFYFELSNAGDVLTIMAHLGKCKPELDEWFLDSQKFFKAKNVFIDKKHNQVMVVKKLDFSKMSPESFALTILQFHSELLHWRQEANAGLGEKVLIKR